MAAMNWSADDLRVVELRHRWCIPPVQKRFFSNAAIVSDVWSFCCRRRPRTEAESVCFFEFIVECCHYIMNLIATKLKWTFQSNKIGHCSHRKLPWSMRLTSRTNRRRSSVDLTQMITPTPLPDCAEYPPVNVKHRQRRYVKVGYSSCHLPKRRT